MKLNSLLGVCLLLFGHSLFAQDGVSINATGADPHASAILDLGSTTKGLLMPRLTSAQRTAIASPAPGLMIFNTDRKCPEWYTGTSWQSATPAGTIEAFGGPATSLPDGWLLCNGSPVSKTAYPDLFAAIGTAFGGNATQFNLPNTRGRFLRGISETNGGADDDRAARFSFYTGGNTGNTVGSYQNENLKTHKHSAGSLRTTTDGNHQHSITMGREGDDSKQGNSADEWTLSTTNTDTKYTNYAGNHDHTVTGDTGNTGGNETRPDNVGVFFIIKY